MNPEHFYDYNSLMQQAMIRKIVGTRAEASVTEQNHNCSPILSQVCCRRTPLDSVVACAHMMIFALLPYLCIYAHLIVVSVSAM